MKKFLSVVLAFLMLAVMLPTTALAADPNLVKVGKDEYATLEAAIAKATPDENGVITYTILGKVTVTSTDSWIQVVRAGLSNVKEVKFVAGQGVTDAEIVINNSVSVLADQEYDIDVSFENLTLSHPKGEWVQDLGHATEFFTCCLRNKGAAENTVTYTNCTFPNGVCNNQYGNTVFDRCTFNNTAAGGYNLWNYGGITKVKNSTFTGTRGIKAYNEGTLGTAPTITISNTSFTGLTEKAAVVVSKATDITFNDVNVTECGQGLINKDIEKGTLETTIVANGTGINAEFKITATTTEDAAKNEMKITEGTFTGNTDSVKDYLPEGKTINSDGAVVDKGATPPTGGTIVITTPAEDTPKTDDQKNPSTGANDMVAAAAALMAVAALGMSILSRKK